VKALNVSTRKDGGRGERDMTKSKGGDKWKSSHCEKICHFKRDCLELKDNDDSMHVEEGSSYEGYENAEALMMSSMNQRRVGVWTQVILIPWLIYGISC
jgi:hypothetical protein